MKLRKLTVGILCTLVSAGSFAIEPSLSVKDIKKSLPSFEKRHQLSTKITNYLLLKRHYRALELDDELSEKIFDEYINILDPQHRIFYQQDIDFLRATYADELDDALENADLTAAEVIDAFVNLRLYEHLSYQLKLTDNEPNLKEQSFLIADRKDEPFIDSKEKMQQLWENRFKNDVIIQYLNGKTWQQTQELLRKRYNIAIKHLSLNKADDILQRYLSAYTNVFDPHTAFYSKTNAQRFEESLANELEGIGATLSMIDDVLTVKSLIKGSPAERSNQIAIDDRIVGVGQEQGEIVDVIGWRINDIIDLIKGKKGTKVRLEIEDPKTHKTKIVTLVRDKVKLEESAAKLTTKTIDGKRISIIEIPSFYNTVSFDVEKLLKKIDPKSIGLIIDLRNNGGGNLREVVRMAGFFIDKGPIVQVKNADRVQFGKNFKGKVEAHYDPHEGILYNGKLIVMTNRFSASASEIFAAAMKDYNRAIIVGQKTYGKGSVQSVHNLIDETSRRYLQEILGTEDPIATNELGLLSYTVQKFYRINGSSNQLAGVEVDIQYPEIINPQKVGEAFEKNALPFDEIKQADYQEWGNARKFVLKLIQKHNMRVKDNPEFKVLNEQIAENLLEDSNNKISVNLNERKAIRNRNDEKRLARLNERFKREGKPVLSSIEDLPKDYEAPDFILDETARIMIDWDSLDLAQKQ